MENREIREGFVGADQSEEVLFTLKTRVKSMVGWARLCALGSLVGVIFLLLLALVLLFLGKYLISLAAPQLAAMPVPIYLYGVIYFVTAAIQLIPTLSLMRFSRHARKWLKSDDVAMLDKSLAGLGGLFVFYGIMTAISLFFIAIGLLFAGIVSIAAI